MKLGKVTKINAFRQTVPDVEDTFSEKNGTYTSSTRIMTFIELEFVATGINTEAENKKKLITFYVNKIKYNFVAPK